MSSRSSRGRGDGSEGDAGADFADRLRTLREEGCNLLVVGDAPRRLFTRASASLLGGSDERRYRLLAATDASRRSVVERLPDPDATPEPFEEITRVVNHAAPPRSITDDRSSELPGGSETRVVDPQLAGLQAQLADAMAAFDRRAGGLRPSELRVGLDSLGPLVDHYGEGVVRQCLRVVTGYVTDYDGMGHYVLARPYDSDCARSLAGEFDAVVEIRAVDAGDDGPAAEERWHVPDRGLTTDWMAL